MPKSNQQHLSILGGKRHLNGLKRRDKKYFSTTRLIKNRSGKTSVVLKVPEHFDIYLAGTRYEESMRFISNLDKMMDSAYILKIMVIIYLTGLAQGNKTRLSGFC